MCNSTTAAPASAEAVIWSSLASTNSETRAPVPLRACDMAAMAEKPFTTSRPPSVVTSSRRSGTRQAA